MKKKLLVLIIAFVSVINISALMTFSYHKWCRYRADCEYRKSHPDESDIYQQLSLSDSQVVQMKSLRQTFHDNSRDMNTTLHKKRSELADLLTAFEVDRDKINSVLDEICSMQNDLQKDVIEYLFLENEILTQVQQEKYFSIIKNRFLREVQESIAHETGLLGDSCETNCQSVNQ